MSTDPKPNFVVIKCVQETHVMVNPASPNPGQRCRGRFGGAVPGAGNRVGGDVNAAPSLQSLGSSHFAGVQNPFDSWPTVSR